MLDKLQEALSQLDGAITEFKEHPMYDEWKDQDEVTLMSSVFPEEEDEEVDEAAFWVDELENQNP